MKLRIATGPDVWHEAEGRLLGLIVPDGSPYHIIEATIPTGRDAIHFIADAPGAAGGGVELIDASAAEREALRAAGFAGLKGL